MELHRVICGQGDAQALMQELSQGVFGVLQKQAVVAERRHGNGHLGQVVQVLQHRTLDRRRRRIAGFKQFMGLCVSLCLPVAVWKLLCCTNKMALDLISSRTAFNPVKSC